MATMRRREEGRGRRESCLAAIPPERAKARRRRRMNGMLSLNSG
jgi:hypothetical protein